MQIKCPQHKIPLEIEECNLDVLGTVYPAAIGKCPSCQVRYINRMIFPACGTYQIDGCSYQYFDELHKAYPPKDVQPVRCNPQNEFVQRVGQEKTVQQIDSPKAKKKSKVSKKKETFRSNLASGTPIHVHKLSYPSVMPQTCSKDGDELLYAARVIIDIYDSKIRTKGWYCRICKTAYILKEDQADVKEKIRRISLKQNGGLDSAQRASMLSPLDTPVNLATSQNTLYVCKGTIYCKRNAHSIDSATGILLGRNGKIVQLNVNYCPQCRKYFISHDEYVHYRKIYGILLGNLKMESASSNKDKEFDLADESILHMCGYSVSQAANLSAPTRREILQYLIDSKVSSKAEIIYYLNHFIGRNGKKSNMEDAVRRWNEDLAWVRNYQINSQHQFEIQNIRKNR